MGARFSVIDVAMLGLLVMALTASPGWAATLLRVNQFHCDPGGFPKSASATVKQTPGEIAIKFKATGLAPGEPVLCSAVCFVEGSFGSSPFVCGNANDRGNWSYTLPLPILSCVGLTPAFSSSSLGICNPSTGPIAP
jgi:hypothetical protein